MSDKRDDTHIHPAPNRPSDGRPIGHVDGTANVIRRRDSFVPGDPIGVIDERGRVRTRQPGIFGPIDGDPLGRIEGDQFLEKDYLFNFSPDVYGYVKDGKVHQANGPGLLQGRIVGEARGSNQAKALAFFALRFNGLSNRVTQLIEQCRDVPVTELRRRITWVQKMREEVRTADVIGDINALHDRLVECEQELTIALKHSYDAARKRKREIVREAKCIANEDRPVWREAAAKLEALSKDQWRAAGYAGPDDDDQLWKELRGHIDCFYRKRNEAREEQAKRRERAKFDKNRIISAAVNICTYESDLRAGREKMQELQAQWKLAGSAGREDDDALWQEFRKWVDAFFAKVHAEAERRREQQRLAHEAKERIVLEAERLASSEEWRETHQRIQELRAAWKEAGSAGREHNDALWARFSAATDFFYQARTRYMEARAAQWEEARVQKQHLIYRAESIANDCDNFREGTDEMRQLQAEWKEAGFAGREHDGRLWQEFRGHVDRFFERKREFFEERNARRSR